MHLTAGIDPQYQWPAGDGVEKTVVEIIFPLAQRREGKFGLGRQAKPRAETGRAGVFEQQFR